MKTYGKGIRYVRTIIFVIEKLLWLFVRVELDI